MLKQKNQTNKKQTKQKNKQKQKKNNFSQTLNQVLKFPYRGGTNVYI